MKVEVEIFVYARAAAVMWILMSSESACRPGKCAVAPCASTNQLTSPGPEGPLRESWEASLRRELSGFRVWGFMVFGPGFRVVGLRFRGLKVLGFGSGVLRLFLASGPPTFEHAEGETKKPQRPT